MQVNLLGKTVRDVERILLNGIHNRLDRLPVSPVSPAIYVSADVMRVLRVHSLFFETQLESFNGIPVYETNAPAWTIDFVIE